MNSGLNPNRGKAKDLLTRAEDAADTMLVMAKDAAELSADQLSDGDTVDIADKVAEAAVAYLDKMGLRKA